tara:strand:- start:583 stop:879 length:297 start_codon:yes stop_codon:yes gene_type:complete
MRKYTLSKKALEENHDKWLRSRGVHPDQLKNKPKYRAKAPVYKIERKHPTSDVVGNGFVRKQSAYSGSGITIGQAYNKGNLVVLSKNEASDAATGKRR